MLVKQSPETTQRGLSASLKHAGPIEQRTRADEAARRRMARLLRQHLADPQQVYRRREGCDMEVCSLRRRQHPPPHRQHELQA